MGRRRLFSVIVPAYKQEKTIFKDLNNIKETLDEVGYDYEIIVVIDGKADKTLENAKKIKSPRLKVFGYQENKGKGYAVRYGMARAKGDLAAFVDAGMDLDPAGLSMALEHFRWYKADIIIGSKRHPVSQIDYPWQRKILSWGYQLLVRILFNLRVRDTQVGLKIFRRKVLEDVLPRLLVKKFAFDIEILAVAHKLGYKRIYEAPIRLEWSISRSIVSKTLWKTLFNMLWDTVAVFYRLKVLRYYDDSNKRKWRYDKDLDFRVNIG